MNESLKIIRLIQPTNQLSSQKKEYRFDSAFYILNRSVPVWYGWHGEDEHSKSGLLAALETPAKVDS